MENLVKRNLIFFVTIVSFAALIIQSSQKTCYAQEQSSLERAGLRSSIYGINPFPNSTWWFNASSDMAARFSGSSAAVIWILGYTTNNGCYLGFPHPNPDSTYNRIYFSGTDNHEVYLDAFDTTEVKVWLQVEPGQADILTLVDLVLTQYGHHSSVIGFGVDVEWYKTDTHQYGKAVTDEEALAWSNRIKSYNENFLLFTKHWLISRMPPTFRDDIVFVDDSQIFQNINSMVDEFEDWANAFAPAKVAFQYGYTSDKIWWQNLNDPPKAIGDEILERCPNTAGLFWVDFTAYDIWPEDFDPALIHGQMVQDQLSGFQLSQNYPNPFNPETNISFSIDHRAYVTLDIFDLRGRWVKNVYNGIKNPGEYKVSVKLNGLGSGVYYYVLRDEKNRHIKKMTLLK